MRSGRFALMNTGVGFKEYLAAVGFEDWAEVERRHGPGAAP
jgi:hypothetical protein